jgi:hypothetical protein
VGWVKKYLTNLLGECHVRDDQLKEQQDRKHAVAPSAIPNRRFDDDTEAQGNPHLQYYGKIGYNMMFEATKLVSEGTDTGDTQRENFVTHRFLHANRLSEQYF